MKTKSLMILGGVTAVVLVLALVSTKSRGSSAADKSAEQPLLPAVKAAVNDIERIEIAEAEKTATLARENGKWIAVDAGGYPASFSKVKEALIALADLKIVETKTKLPENHERLGLDATKGSTVTLIGPGGSEVASVVLGDTVYARSGQRIYARRKGEDQTYLCEGDLTVSGDPMTWVDKEVLRLDNSRPSAVEVRRADGETLRISKTYPAAANWDVAGVPPDRALKSESVANVVGTALSYLSFDDVRRAEELALEENAAGTTTFQTFDGLFVDVRTAKIGEEHWITLNARFEPPPEVAGPPPAPAPEDSAEDPAADPEADPEPSETEPAAETVSPVTPEKLEEVRKEADELNERFRGWAFKVPKYKADVLLRRMEELLTPLPEPAAATSGEPAPGESDGMGEIPPPVAPPEAGEPPASSGASGDAAEKPAEPPPIAAPEGGAGAPPASSGASGDDAEKPVEPPPATPPAGEDAGGGEAAKDG